LILFNLFALHHQQVEARQRSLVQEKELSELKLRFFQMASHEFRNPLSLILGSAQLLIENTQGWSLEKKLTNLERIQSAARVMNQLLIDMLTLNRAEAGKLEFAPAPIEKVNLELVRQLQSVSLQMRKTIPWIGRQLQSLKNNARVKNVTSCSNLLRIVRTEQRLRC
jgi:signal transduction histidine kinase